MAKLPVPKLPSFGKLPTPKFGNIARAIKTPAQQITSAGTSIASAKKQPPPPPSRKFDSALTDEKLAQANLTEKKFTPDFNSAMDADQNTGGELTAAQKRFKEAVAGNKKVEPNAIASNNAGGLWNDYQADPANSPSTNNLKELAKVNHQLYDQYGKLTTSSSSPKLSEPFDPKSFAAKATNADIEKTNQSVAELKAQLEKMKARGTGTSDDFSIPSRSAVELAGSAPLKPIEVKPEVALHKGFGKQIQLKPASDLEMRGTVTVPDPTAPANVLRASANIPGLVQPTEIAGPGKYSTTQFGDYASNKVDPLELPTGNRLPDSNEDLVANEFVESMNRQEIPTLTATTKANNIEMTLPREVSEASLAAIAENARVAAEVAPPKITFQNPIKHTPVKMPQQVAPLAIASTPPAPPVATMAAVAEPTPSSAFNLPATQSPRVTRNQFFNRPIESAAPLNVEAVAPKERVAKAPIQEFAPMSIMQQPESAATRFTSKPGNRRQHLRSRQRSANRKMNRCGVSVERPKDLLHVDEPA